MSIQHGVLTSKLKKYKEIDTKQMNRPPTLNIAKGAMREGILSMTALLYELSFLFKLVIPTKLITIAKKEWC